MILDLDDDGIELTELQNSTVFMDSNGDGLDNRTAWAGDGDGVLFFDADGDGTISEKREYVFTEWDPTATSDIEALRAVFDSNGDGVFDASDDAWGNFKVLVTNADGSLEAKTLDELGITSIDLTADATNIELPDGSVITGKTTFTYSDGSTGTVADTMLVSDTTSYRIEETESVDGSGTRTQLQTGYAADSTIAFVITSVTTADGFSITNSYDTNGDGVVDRLQTIVTVTNPDGSESETVTNVRGSDLATGILLSETKTTTSADGNTVTIERDSTGGGWYDQTEVRTTHADDSMTIVTTDRDPNGGVIRSSTETVSADGLTRMDAIDEDGDGMVDLTITHSIVVNADGSRSETIEHFNQDGSLRSAVTESVSADGQTKTIARDLDGDGDVDVQEELDIVVNADGTTDSTLTVKNGNGSVRSSTTHSQSDDALTKSSAVDQDGDGDVDLTTVEATVIHADGSRETETVLTNTDGSVRAKTKVTLGSDQVSSETWVDHNQDGIFQSTDLSRSVTVDGTTGDRTTTSWTRNADGSFSAQSISVSSEDGLVVNTEVDADGDGDTDLSISDVTVENADGTSTRTVTETAQSGALKSEQVVTTSADGLTVTTLSDVDGDGVADGKSVSVQASNADGSTLHTTTSYAGDETTLLGETTVSQSADRRLTITTSDANGDGATDMTLRSEKHADGSMTELETRFSADGTTLSTRQTDVSADGLTVSVASDLDGDGDTDTTSVQATVLNADGGRTTTSTVRNGDSSLRSQMVTTVSDDGLVVTTSEDTDGDGVFERSMTPTTVLNADGSRNTTEDVHSSDGSLLSRSETTISDDGLTVEARADTDGDQATDIATISVTTLNDDGSTTVTTEVTDVTGVSDVMRSRVITTTSDNGRDILETTDIDGDGDVDMRVHRVIGDDGHVTISESELNSDGSLQSQLVSETSDTGLESTTRYDADGDGTYERRMESTTALNADGSTTQTVEEKAEDGSVYRRTVTETSRDGWTTTTREDWDNDGDDDLTTTQVYDLSAAGVETTTVTHTAADGSTLSTDTTTVSADKRSTTRSVDADGNGVDDVVSTANVADDGTQTRQNQYYDETGALIANTIATVSGDGLTITTRTDRNGDGTDELVATATTVLGTDGSQTVTTDYTDGSGAQLARTVATSSDDGLSTSWSADLDGDGTNEFVTTGSTAYEADGDVVQTATTTDEAGGTLSSVTTTTSGNGLSIATQTDLDGDGANDLTRTRTVEANGAWNQTEQQFGSGASLVHDISTTQSADGRTSTIEIDEDGDGNADRDVIIAIDEDRTTTSTWRDLNTAAAASAIITGIESANGSELEYAFDLDGDGTSEFTRATDISYDASGARIAQHTETIGSRLGFEETVTTSFDGLQQTVETDIDGDGDTDTTQISTTTLHDDGRQTSNITATYADGGIKSTLVRETAADGRTETETRDYDGDGNTDVEVTSTIAADGSLTRTEESFDAEGALVTTRTTEVSADGLITTITTNDTSLTIIRSPIGNGSYETSYSSDDLSYTSSHHVDGAGLETWTLQHTEGGVTETFEVWLDPTMKARVIAEAERLYDTLLDRNIDRSEVETLIVHVQDGELDIESLADELIQSDEFEMRYGEMSDAAFVNQIYLNTYGRGASLDEFADDLANLADGTVTRALLAAVISESSEHVVIGNGHMSTNNFDVFLNPAQAERSIDDAYLSATVADLVAVLYGTQLSDVANNLLMTRMHQGQESIQGIAARLANGTSDVVPDSSIDLYDMTDSEFVTHVLQTAFGNAPSTDDVTAWSTILTGDQLSRGEFALMIARSTEYAASGSLSYASSNVTRIEAGDSQNFTVGSQAIDGVFGDDRNNSINGSGSSRDLELEGNGGNDTLTGGSGSDFIYGGAGADTISGNSGNDYLFVDFADLTSGSIQGGAGFDTLQVLDTQAVTIVMPDHSVEAVYSGSGDDDIRAAGYSYGVLISGGDGDDVLKGGDGADHIYGDNGNDDIFGDAGDDYIFGGDGDDIIDSDDGDDYVYGGAGDDRIYGWTGADLLNGGEGSDRADYAWSTSGVTVDLTNGTGSGGHAQGDTFVDIESVYGSSHDDVLTGNAENNVFYGRAGNDSLHGMGGDDRLYAYTGAELLDGGAGIDIVDYWASNAGVHVNLSTGSVSGGHAQGDTIVDIEKVYGGDHDDTLIGDDGDNWLWGRAGNDTLLGGDGDDNLYAYSGVEVLDGGSGVDFADYWTSDAGVNIDLTTGTASGGHAQGDTLIDIEELGGSDYDDTLTGNELDNYLNGREGDNNLYGKGGDDWLVAGSGVDFIDGGTGNDQVDYRFSDSGVTVNLSTGTASGGFAEGDTLVNIEHIDGSHFDDILTGDELDSDIWGGDGDDIINGAEGNDWLKGDNGNDNLFAGAGDDILNGGSGADHLDGGAGLDEVEYLWSEAAVTVNLALGLGSGGYAEGDTYFGIENARGSEFGDTLIGNAADNRLFGDFGDDKIEGGLGADTIIGGEGNDLLTGGLGSDDFVFGDNLGSDTILDFEDGIDSIRIEIAGLSFEDLTIVDVNGDTVVTVGGHGSVTLEDIDFLNLTSEDVSFV